MLWTEEDLRQLRQEGAERPENTAREQPRVNQREVWQRTYNGRDPGSLFWGIVEPWLTPEERRIWAAE